MTWRELFGIKENKNNQQVPRSFVANQKQYPYYNNISLANSLKSWSGICINTIARTVASIPMYAVSKDSKGELIPLKSEHWLSQLLNNPNKPNKLTLSEIQRMLVSWLLCNGNSYIFTPSLGAKYPVQIWILPSNNVNINPGSNLVESFEVISPNGTEKFSPLEICHVKTLAPSTDWNKNYITGSPISLNNAIDSINADYEMKQFIKNHFEQEALSPLIIKGDWSSDEEYNFFKQTLKRGGVRNSIAGTVPNSVDLLPIEQSTIAKNTIQNQMAGDINAKQIAAAFGIPFGILDTTSQQNKSTAEENAKYFRENTIEPLLLTIENYLTQHFQQFEQNVYIVHDSYAYVDKDNELERLKLVVGANSITVNELRNEYNLKPINDGDVLINQNQFNDVLVTDNNPIKELKKKV